jgi:hypothetical protein
MTEGSSMSDTPHSMQESEKLKELIQCPACGAWIDMDDRDEVLEHRCCSTIHTGSAMGRE